MSDLKDTLMIELAYCKHANLPVPDTAARIDAIIMRRHLYWGAGEPDCPREIKAGNGELHTLRCKVCGQDDPRDRICTPCPTEDQP
jgi:hypothetical protein